MRETKKTIVNDVKILIAWCYENDKKDQCLKVLQDFKQNLYLSDALFTRSLMSKNKNVLDQLREILLEKVVY